MKKNGLSCAVITPIGPGHEEIYRTRCAPSIEYAIKMGLGPFQSVTAFPVWDDAGVLGRSVARNQGVAKAAAGGYDWVFFLDADDVLHGDAFLEVASYIEDYDAIWGAIIEANSADLSNVKYRDNQIAQIDSLQTLVTHDPFLTIQMGHFVRASVAIKYPFDSAMNAGEDFKYYLQLWGNEACVKVNSVFFVNIRGSHSTGPRSASAQDWRASVTDQLRVARANLSI